MNKFKAGDRVAVVNRQDKWNGFTGTVKSIDEDFGLGPGAGYKIALDEPSRVTGLADGVHAYFLDFHLELIEPEVEEDFVEDDYTRSSRLLKNYMEDHRLLAGDFSEEYVEHALKTVLEADMTAQGYSDDTANDEAIDSAVWLMTYLDTIRPVLEAYWRNL